MNSIWVELNCFPARKVAKIRPAPSNVGTVEDLALKLRIVGELKFR